MSLRVIEVDYTNRLGIEVTTIAFNLNPAEFKSLMLDLNH